MRAPHPSLPPFPILYARTLCSLGNLPSLAFPFRPTLFKFIHLECRTGQHWPRYNAAWDTEIGRNKDGYGWGEGEQVGLSIHLAFESPVSPSLPPFLPLSPFQFDDIDWTDDDLTREKEDRCSSERGLRLTFSVTTAVGKSH